jgi:hypothetical protein
MRPPQARKIIKGILDNSDYFVISADGLEYFHDRFIDLSFASVNIDTFASIIAQVDSVVTVDTSTYHLADAFDKPTVVLFTTIEPKLRVPYYPYTDSIMLENEGGMIYGEHHAPKEPEKLAKYIEYVDNKWEELDVSEILAKLRKMEEKLMEVK